MGTGMKLKEVEFFMDKSVVSAAFAVMRQALEVFKNRKENLYRAVGGRTGKTLQEVMMGGIHFRPREDDDGNIIDLDFEGEYTDNLHAIAFAAIAPFVKPGSFIEAFDDECNYWRWVFTPTGVTEIKPTFVWPEVPV